MSLLMTSEAATSLSQRSNLTVTSIRYINIVPRLEQQKEFISVRYVSITYYINLLVHVDRDFQITVLAGQRCQYNNALYLPPLTC